MNKLGYIFAAAAAAVAAPAAAVTLVSAPVTLNATDAGQASGTFSRLFNGIVSTNSTPGLAATIDFALNTVTNSGKTWNFTANIMNQAGSPFTSARISAMGLLTNPDITGATVTSGPFLGVDLNGNFPQVSTNVGFCFTAGPNCNGGSGGGVTMANTPETQVFSLTFASAPTNVTFDNFIIRWQSLESPTIKGGSGIGLGRVPGTVDPFGVPEPSSWAMLIAGFGLVGATMRRRAQRGLTVAA